jgi:hypothetical protein
MLLVLMMSSEVVIVLERNGSSIILTEPGVVLEHTLYRLQARQNRSENKTTARRLETITRPLRLITLAAGGLRTQSAPPHPCQSHPAKYSGYKRNAFDVLRRDVLSVPSRKQRLCLRGRKDLQSFRTPIRTLLLWGLYNPQYEQSSKEASCGAHVLGLKVQVQTAHQAVTSLEALRELLNNTLAAAVLPQERVLLDGEDVAVWSEGGVWKGREKSASKGSFVNPNSLSFPWDEPPRQLRSGPNLSSFGSPLP